MAVASTFPRVRSSKRWKRGMVAHAFDYNLDRVHVLGSDVDGHTGRVCVNALSWADDGNLLLSGGDDTTVRLWRMDTSSSERYPFVCQSVINTGHTANIFGAQMLPYSTKIATVAGDRQVRVFDAMAAASISSSGPEASYNAGDCSLRVLRCHSRPTKRIVTEDSPDLFLTVAEDGTVRQHDLRAPPHACRRGCPPPLVKLPIDLSTLARSPLTPYQFVVAGESPYGYLFDRRQIGRFLKEEWGMPMSNDFTTCVRRFGRERRGSGERSRYVHITGARMPSSNGHEVMSPTSDAVYLFSTRDDIEDSSGRSSGTGSGILAPNSVQDRLDASDTSSAGLFSRTGTRRSFSVNVEMQLDGDDGYDSNAEDWQTISGGVDTDADNVSEGSSLLSAERTEEAEEDLPTGFDTDNSVPIIYPRRRFSGARNVETIKDVNFLGPSDEFIVSGSDDGNWFMWRKETGALCGIYEGDDQVVNVVEGHPHLPLVAVSGIDTTVKLFAPTAGPSAASKTERAESIMTRNRETPAQSPADLASLFFWASRLRNYAGEEQGGNSEPQCTFQ
ncbi:WD repeat-containing protein [Amylostereum chailletii]|nr:WD repeat-containing protein [Amylostereum chailletii]